MNVTLVQTDLAWENKMANLEQLAEQFSRQSIDTDLVVLPEMFTTGFSMNPAPLAEEMDGPTLKWLSEQAAKLDAAITGSFIAEVDGLFYNRLIWMFPDGSYQHYDKRHLFTLAGEHQHYSAGADRLLIEWKGWKICPLICYDLRFPVWSRNNEKYDLLLYVANWPERRRHHWQSLLVARAIENQAYTIGVNRVGKDGKDINYSGDSCLIDYAGETRVKLAYQETLLTVSLDKPSQDAYREKYAFLADQDSFQVL